MARVREYQGFLFRWEGEWANDPDDRGGLTFKGVTEPTWRVYGKDLNGDGVVDAEDLALLTNEQLVALVLKPGYWDACRADELYCQELANMLVDWYWCSGPPAIRAVQRCLGLTADGIVGERTLLAINGHACPAALFDRIRAARLEFLENLCRRRPQNRKFLRGWRNRVLDLPRPKEGLVL